MDGPRVMHGPLVPAGRLMLPVPGGIHPVGRPPAAQDGDGGRHRNGDDDECDDNYGHEVPPRSLPACAGKSTVTRQ
ncbi:hypothetical protein SBRY_60012 [Actinacidiphila bryophytorum]|uniref:Uncharacterized protein n=1 Tax=Actinacidiphila bryophytorum TaxID=1436133 RepID=A0A9W4H5T2_9ACTN|nr:hypothetical protein SBRY_60012 [Actinacidiphila bryophytorum]